MSRKRPVEVVDEEQEAAGEAQGETAEEGGKPEDPIHRILKAQAEAQQQESSQGGKMAATGEGKAFEPATTGQPQTGAPAAGTRAASTAVAQPPPAQATLAAHAKDEL